MSFTDIVFFFAVLPAVLFRESCVPKAGIDGADVREEIEVWEEKRDVAADVPLEDEEEEEEDGLEGAKSKTEKRSSGSAMVKKRTRREKIISNK